MKLYAIHHHSNLHKYSFETSQQARMNLVKMNEIGYTRIMTRVQFCKNVEDYSMNLYSVTRLPPIYINVPIRLPTTLSVKHYLYVENNVVVKES